MIVVFITIPWATPCEIKMTTMKMNLLASALRLVLCIQSLQALSLPFNVRSINVQIIASTLSKILPVPPAFALGDGGSKIILPPPPSETTCYLNGNDRNNLLVTLVAVANHTIGTPLNDMKINMKLKPVYTVRKWWKEQSNGRSGILVFLLPALIMQLQIFAATAPFVIERLTQYLNPPLAILAGIALLRPINGISFLQQTLWISMAVGAVSMLYDTYTAGVNWSPLHPAVDSYAVVTGSDQMLGGELARRLYSYGYHLVLIGDSADELQSLRQALLDSASEPSVPATPAPQRLVADLARQCEKIPHFVSEQLGKVPELHRGFERLQELTQQWKAQPAVQQCVQRIKAHLPLNGTVQAMVAELKHTAAARSQPSNAQFLAGTSLVSNNTTDGVTERYTTASNSGNSGNSRSNNNNKASSTAQLLALSKQKHPQQAGHTNPPQQLEMRDIQAIVADWTDPQAPYKAATELKERQIADKMEVLVHAASKHFTGPLSSTSTSCAQQMIQSNVQAAVTLTQLLLPDMLRRCSGGITAPGQGNHRPRTLSTAIASWLRNRGNPSADGSGSTGGSVRAQTGSEEHPTVTSDFNDLSKHRGGGGRILFISSLGAAGPAPCNSVYAASKAFLSSFAQSLRRELLPGGVLVTVANCGAIKGNFPHRNVELQSRIDSPSVSSGAGAQWEDRSAGAMPSEQPAPPLMLMPPPLVAAAPLPPRSREHDEVYATVISSTDAGTEAPLSGTTVDSTFCSTQCSPFSVGLGHDEDHPAGVFPIAAATGAAGGDDRELNAIVKNPFIHRIPGGTLTAEQVSVEILSALRTGRDAVTPGLWNKAYLHGIAKILPAPALAALHQVAWSPQPAWASPASWRLPTVKSLSSLSSLSSAPPLHTTLRVPSLTEVQDSPAVRRGSAAAKKLFKVAINVTDKLGKVAKRSFKISGTSRQGNPST